MIGRTNACAGGMKCVTGKFTSSDTETQKSFTVAGLDFEPKIVAVFGGSPVEVGNEMGEILVLSFADIENGKGYYAYKPSYRSGSYNVNGSPNLNVTKVEAGYKITASRYFFSDISDGNGWRDTFNYYIYG